MSALVIGCCPTNGPFAGLSTRTASSDPGAPKHLPKIVFLMLMRNERLAGLATSFDEARRTLTVRQNGDVKLQAQLVTGSVHASSVNSADHDVVCNLAQHYGKPPPK